MANDTNAWFAPKRHGYGAGLPTAWQGWMLLAVYVAAIAVAAVYLIQRSIPLYLGVVAVATVVLVLIAKAKTSGEWRWRRGED